MQLELSNQERFDVLHAITAGMEKDRRRMRRLRVDRETRVRLTAERVDRLQALFDRVASLNRNV